MSGWWTRASMAFAFVAVLASVMALQSPPAVLLAVVSCLGAAVAASKAQQLAIETRMQLEGQLACLREAVRERSFSREEQRHFTHRLQLEARGAVRIYFPAFDGEAAKLAAAIEGMFRDARW